jgi:hypothetical protein
MCFIVSEQYEFVIGVDTHAATHTFALVTGASGAVLDHAVFPATAAGLSRAERWLVRRVGDAATLVVIEGTGSFCAILAGREVVEAARMPGGDRRGRQERRARRHADRPGSPRSGHHGSARSAGTGHRSGAGGNAGTAHRPRSDDRRTDSCDQRADSAGAHDRPGRRCPQGANRWPDRHDRCLARPRRRSDHHDLPSRGHASCPAHPHLRRRPGRQPRRHSPS